jgi:hypothetical protein
MQQVDQTSGFVFVSVLDCHGQPAEGATIDLATAPGQTPATPVSHLYIADGVVSGEATATDVSGTGGLLGVPTGYKRITARRNGPAGEAGGVAGIRVPAATFSYVTIILSPSTPDPDAAQ